MCLVRPALLYFNVHVIKVIYEQINYYYYYYYYYYCIRNVFRYPDGQEVTMTMKKLTKLTCSTFATLKLIINKGYYYTCSTCQRHNRKYNDCL